MDRWKSDISTGKSRNQLSADAIYRNPTLRLNILVPELYGYGVESIIWEEFEISLNEIAGTQFFIFMTKIVEFFDLNKPNNILVEVNKSLLEAYIVIRNIDRLVDNGFYIFGPVKTIRKFRRSLLYGRQHHGLSIEGGTTTYLRAVAVRQPRTRGFYAPHNWVKDTSNPSEVGSIQSENDNF